jgi:isoquinoline 1-oxidoreductase beta subunit
VEAAEVAKVLKRPVKVIWTREDDMKGGYYRPLYHSRLSGGLDNHGKPIAWCHTLVGQSIMKGTIYASMRIKNGIDISSTEGAITIPYEIPNLFVGLHSPEVAVPVQWWRSVGHSHTCFAVESFIDEMAFAAGKDPYEFRRALLVNHPRHRGVLDLAAHKAGWGTPTPAGHSRGIAMCESYGSFVAEVAEVSMEPSGNVRVHRVVCAVDCGNTMNPSIIEAQMESGIVFGLTAALYGEITIQKGRVEQENFNTYTLLRIGRMPAVEVYIVPSSENPGGIGEPGTPPIAPAVTNAIFAATGKRIRRLPIASGRRRVPPVTTDAG